MLQVEVEVEVEVEAGIVDPWNWVASSSSFVDVRTHSVEVEQQVDLECADLHLASVHDLTSVQEPASAQESAFHQEPVSVQKLGFEQEVASVQESAFDQKSATVQESAPVREFGSVRDFASAQESASGPEPASDRGFASEPAPASVPAAAAYAPTAVPALGGPPDEAGQETEQAIFRSYEDPPHRELPDIGIPEILATPVGQGLASSDLGWAHSTVPVPGLRA